ncbi:SDR family NAD(P)-dependent oxidoreductase [Pelagibacterales bacterium SAG-MED03]|nr:SDR family NAD(P)-dependent oxidoreductase [Pelagibacterales bacterium SAG-MED03]
MNKNILVIGGHKGIGLLISRYLIDKCKYNTISTSSKKIDKRKKSYNKFNSFQIDLTKLKNLQNFFNFIKKRKISNFDTVIISSGTLGTIGNFESSTIQDYKKTFQINLFGQIELCKFLLKKKLLRNNSNLIFLSTSLNIPDPFFIQYSASKHAQYALMLSLSEELKNKKIFVNCLMPGQFHTEMNQRKIKSKKKISKKIFNQALKTKNINDNNKIKNIEKTLDVLIQNNSVLKITGKIISAQNDNLKKYNISDKNCFSFIRKI